MPRREGHSGRTTSHSLLYYCREFDAAGLFLLSAGLALFLLPFNIYSLQDNGWRTPWIICMAVIGFTLIIAFIIWEKLYAPITFMPYSLLLDRTVLGACVLSATLFISYYCWASYFSSFLMVVKYLNVTDASYVSNIYSVGNTFSALFIGWLIRNTGRYKAICLWFAIPLHILGIGLMINFRQPSSNIGYIIMCQVFVLLLGALSSFATRSPRWPSPCSISISPWFWLWSLYLRK